jgi:hypothetical protein
MGDSTARDALARNICARICRENRTRDELLVMDLLLSGIEQHEDEYGGADLSSDTRDLTDELDQELQDGLFYILLRAVKRRAKRIDRIARFKSADLGLNKTGADCTDCAAPVDELHADGCQWVEVVR